MLEQMKKWLPFKRGDKSAKRIADPRDVAHPMARELGQLMARFGLPPGWWGATGDRADSWFGDFSPSVFLPTLDLADKHNRLEVTVELPGLEPGDIDIDVQEGALVIRGEKRLEETTEDEGFYRTERSFGAFERAIPLPAEVQADRAEATFKKGVLKIVLPKAKPAPSAKKVEIKVS